MIPRIIMQTWKTKDVPDHWKSSPQSIKQQMPHWRYHLMTDTDNLAFVTKYFPSFLDTYINFPKNIQRADAIRYMWLYINGGVYTDLDYLFQRPIDDLLVLTTKPSVGDQLYLVHSNKLKTSITNSMMASTAYHPFWLACIEEMKRGPAWWMKINEDLLVLQTTGPGMITRVINNGKWYYNKLPEILLGPSNYCDCDISDPNAYTRSLEGSSWINPQSNAIYKNMYCNSNIIMLIMLLIALVILLIYLCK